MNWQKYLDDYLSLCPWIPRSQSKDYDPKTELERIAPESIANIESLSGGRVLGEFGVNLVGFARSELGLGEDLRSMAKTLEAIPGLPFCIYRLAYPGLTPEQGSEFNSYESPFLKYSTSIYHLPAMEHARLSYSQGIKAREKSYRIGFWPWELNTWSDSLLHCFDSADEIWALSDFIADTYRKVTNKTVRKIPLPVYLTTQPISDRQKFKIPEDKFVFLATFDSSSSLRRKNPLAVVKAFKMAFPKNDDVALILKTMRADFQTKEWCDVLLESNGDNRITILDDVLSKNDLLTLKKSCDAYVSLHRAEGFGRGLAEAMLLEKPVIATGYSGNTDFCLPSTSLLVDFKLIALQSDDYHFTAPQTSWADPNVEHAAERMKQVFTRQGTDTLVRQARFYVESKHSPAKVASHVEKYLNEI